MFKCTLEDKDEQVATLQEQYQLLYPRGTFKAFFSAIIKESIIRMLWTLRQDQSLPLTCGLR